VQEDLSLNAAGVPRAPSADGAVVAVPPLHAVGRLLADNRARQDAFARAAPDVLGVPWGELARQARQAAVSAARDYLARRGEPVPPPGPEDLLLAGQGEVLDPHAGVEQLRLVAGLARAHGRTALNLVVDNDTVKATALRVPAPPAPAAADGLPPVATLRTIPFDRWAGEVPYEEQPVTEPGLFASFADRVMDVLGGWGYEPLLPEFWAEVLRLADRTPLLGELFAGARRGLERAWGCRNLELPISELCRTAPFRRFACQLLADLPRFHAVYNAAVGDYRRRNGIRSRNHPVPDLAAEGDWLETPFWGWRAGQARRGRLFARATPAGVELRAGADAWPALPPPPERPEDSVAALGELEARGLKVRTRALTTTLFSRLLLADLFAHGIGGGKYDELTDDIVRRFWRAEPPAFLILSATLWLPPAQAEPEDVAARLARTTHDLRDLRWNPQRHLDALAGDPAVRALAGRRAEWVARPAPAAADRRRRFEALRELTEALRRPLVPRERHLASEQQRLRHLLAGQEVLRRRDYAFCLYPGSSLRPFCAQFLAPPDPRPSRARSAAE
jgi:hypothetical protein